MAEVESWAEYRIHLIRTLERLEDAINTLGRKIDTATKDGNIDLGRVRDDLRAEIAKSARDITALQIEFGMQRVRVGLIGSAAGAIVGGIIAYAVKHLS